MYEREEALRHAGNEEGGKKVELGLQVQRPRPFQKWMMHVVVVGQFSNAAAADACEWMDDDSVHT